MIALFFEVQPKPHHEATYFEMAAKLKPELDASGGMDFLDRSRSNARPGWFLSHQFWQDEASMTRWRVNGVHHRAQVCGRTDILDDYRLRVAQVIAEYRSDSPPSAMPVPPYATYNDPSRVDDRYILSILSRDGPVEGVDGESFASVYDPKLTVTVVTPPTGGHAFGLLAQAASFPTIDVLRLGLVSRDYGMFDRAEAPQYFEPVTLA
jgi:heme-degrading monooxygenase HmoA